MTDTGPQLVEVRIIGMSLAAFRSSSEHHDELFREFRLLLAREPSPGHSVPLQLLDLIEELDRRFSGFTSSPQAELDEALARGQESIDLVYQVPREVRDASIEFTDLLRKADEYCRQGDLLTLAPPPEAIHFRDWYLGEFIAQIDGADPVPWPSAANTGG
ncbi:MAG: hypothetical protein QOG64_538 [Acidimicrobiaceae bacterium]|nr:hypothetical protein [Acidimicrobiaceae bacterium]